MELIPQTVVPNTKGQLKASNPVTFVRWSNKTDYEAFILKPEQTMAVLDLLVQPEYTLLLLVAGTGVRISEALALRWKSVLYDQNSTRIKNSWTYGRRHQNAGVEVHRAHAAGVSRSAQGVAG